MSDPLIVPKTAPESLPESSPEQGNSFLKELFSFAWETARIVIISLAIILPIRYYLVQPFFVKGASMEPNFHDGDYLLIDEISYRFEDPERGQVIVFRYPEDETQFFIKRIVGVPGDKVVIQNNAVKIFNDTYPEGLTLSEPYLAKGQVTIGDLSFTLATDQYYVLGDNRVQSADSRRWGPVPRNDIVGRVMLRAWPFATFKLIPQAMY